MLVRASSIGVKCVKCVYQRIASSRSPVGSSRRTARSPELGNEEEYSVSRCLDVPDVTRNV